MKISIHIEEWELIQPFRISGHEWIHSRSIVVQLADDGWLTLAPQFVSTTFPRLRRAWM